MDKYYATNICLPIGEVNSITTGKDKDPNWPSETRSSTDVLIKNPKRRTECRQQLVAVLFSCWINLVSGVSIGYVTPALPSLQQPSSRLRITDSEGSWIASLVMLGALFGGILAGPCISLGRRSALWIASLPLTVAWILIGFAPNVWFLYASHIILGLCLGIIGDASQLYVSEVSSANLRGALGCFPVLMFNLGILVCYIAGSVLPWEQLAFLGGAISLPSLLLPLIYPETPSYLVSKGKIEDALVSLQSLRGRKEDVTAEYQELLRCERGPSLKQRLKGIMDRDLLRPLILTSAVRALSRFCGLRAILCYTHIIFVSSHSALSVKAAMMIMGVVQLLATLAACFMIDRLGRRKLLIISQIIMGIALLTLGSYLYFYNNLSGITMSFLGFLPIITILIYIVANSIGLGPVSGIIIGELVPQRHRSIASSFTGAISWLGAFAVTKSFLDICSAIQLYGAFWLYGSMCILGVVFVYFLVPETRGLSQYNIDRLFSSEESLTTKIEVEKPEDKIVTISDVCDVVVVIDNTNNSDNSDESVMNR